MLMFISIKAICFLAGLLIGFLMNIIAILLEKLNELVKTGSRRDILLCRIETNVAIINYVNLKANIMDNNTNTVLFLFLVLFFILVLFAVSTGVFAVRLKKSKENEQSTNIFNQKIIEASVAYIYYG